MPSKEYKRAHPEKWRDCKKRYYNQFRPARRGNLKYTNLEDSIICASGSTDREIHETIGRSVAAIQIRRSRLREKISKTITLPYKNHDQSRDPL